jgi:hypothetical protein
LRIKGVLGRILGALYARSFFDGALAMDLCALSVQVLRGSIAIIAGGLS